MTGTRRDLEATALTALVVLAYAATHQGWNVWLIGDSHRWAAGAILVLGAFACGLGSSGKGIVTWILAALGVAAGVLGVIALVTGSLAALSFLTIDIVLLWVASTVRHARQGHSPASV